MTHPAPARGEVSNAALWVGIFGAPVLWSVQLLSNYAFMAQGCSPAPDGRLPLALGSARGVAEIVTLVALAGGLIAGVTAWRAWQATRAERDSRGADAHVSLLETGEGRTRFMAFFGLLASGLFLIAVLFGGVALLFVPGCG